MRDAAVDEPAGALRAGEPDPACPAPDARELPEGLAVHAARHEELVLIAAPGHPLAAAGRTLIRDLAEEPFVDFRAGTGPETAVRRPAALPRDLGSARAGRHPPPDCAAASPAT
ncbi:LysR substrate-binding domain-containing protein [Streptomyces griseomycini]|uniref:DNA-binding transcriptional LysR family regulator n=1 Tax=Streptomyces griseomycini TaxID=66895 RepID=A0A7W7PT38_9ACTN|nr:LysR substrate-binding domain-containing protein [Streptomyces griseomycini]MBB4900791.1 DNA-binding transcriptional LysR family regulator [Streptomyces griseomycini]